MEGIIDAFKKNDKSTFESNFNSYKQTNTGGYDEWKKTIFNRLYNKIAKDGGGYNDYNNNNNNNNNNSFNDENPYL